MMGPSLSPARNPNFGEELKPESVGLEPNFWQRTRKSQHYDCCNQQNFNCQDPWPGILKDAMPEPCPVLLGHDPSLATILSIAYC